MVAQRAAVWSALITVLAVSAGFGSATAGAAELSDYRWERRPLLVFAPADSDPRVVEMLSRIEASRCEFVDRDMVTGLLVTAGTSTLDGHVVGAEESARLRDRYAVGESDFTVLLIGKDGGEKLRVNQVPDLGLVYSVIDGMPMRGREMAADPSRC
ncbi:MAG: DUF4174 domain-containing protein [Actinomycetota bacterium]|nr:DUF4174 domain-containing protein [Actinomycetota bacterium]